MRSGPSSSSSRTRRGATRCSRSDASWSPTPTALRLLRGENPFVCAWAFTLTYGAAVWKALLVALVVAAVVDVLVPRRSLVWALAVLLAALIGTVLVLPTAGEIPILLGLAAAGASAGVLGALLIALPAVSLPSAVMVGRALGWRTTAATGGATVACALVAGGVLLLVGA